MFILLQFFLGQKMHRFIGPFVKPNNGGTIDDWRELKLENLDDVPNGPLPWIFVPQEKKLEPHAN